MEERIAEISSIWLNKRFEYNLSLVNPNTTNINDDKRDLNSTTTEQQDNINNPYYLLRNDISRGFVRYVGFVDTGNNHDEKQNIFVGVEWDREERGKHDGEVRGKRYFQTLNQKKSASFIKLETFLRFSTLGKSLTEALQEKYKKTEGFKEEEMFIYSSSRKHQIPVELVGREGIEKKFEQTEKLKKVGLMEMNISTIVNDGSLTKLLPMICEIDLTANLIDNWEFIEILLEELPTLEHLMLSSNRFSYLNVLSDKKYPKMKSLVLNDTFISWVDLIYKILPKFPNLEELHFRDNDLNEKDLQIVTINNDILQQLKLLNLSGNKIKEWNEISKSFCKLPNLFKILLNFNEITNITYEGGFDKLNSFSFAHNKVEEWDSINELNKFPSIQEVRMDSNLIQDKYGAANVRQFTIARIASLKSLNSSEIKNKERTDAEKYYLHLCGKEKFSNKNNPQFNILDYHPRYEELVKIYGDPCEVLENQSQSNSLDSGKTDFVTIYFKNVAASSLSFVGVPVEKKIPKSMTVFKIKQMCQRLFKVEASRQKLFYIDEDLACPESLYDDLKEISYYGVLDGGNILVDEIDEEQERRDEENKKKIKDQQMKEQQDMVERYIQWKIANE
ncbi:hypothetical protein ABK040_010676 [Willaertia magna]